MLGIIALLVYVWKTFPPFQLGFGMFCRRPFDCTCSIKSGIFHGGNSFWCRWIFEWTCGIRSRSTNRWRISLLPAYRFIEGIQHTPWIFSTGIVRLQSFSLCWTASHTSIPPLIFATLLLPHCIFCYEPRCFCFFPFWRR